MEKVEELINEACENSVRKTKILEISKIDKLDSNDDGVELNNGYDYETNTSLPELADALAKLAIAFDDEFKDKSGGAFIHLIQHFYDMTLTNKDV